MKQLSYTIRSAADATGFSPKTIDRAIKSGALKAKWSSATEDGEPAGQRVILASALEAWLEGLVDA